MPLVLMDVVENLFQVEPEGPWAEADNGGMGCFLSPYIHRVRCVHHLSDRLLGARPLKR
jgi:hypothetical protein